MLWSSPIPRAKQPTFHEGSSLRSMRDSDSTARQWLRAQTHGRDINASAGGMGFMIQKLNRMRRRMVGGGALSGSGNAFKGEWSPTASYATGSIVAFTPDGSSAGLYFALKPVAAGISPDTGSPNWFAAPNSPPSVWA